MAKRRRQRSETAAKHDLIRLCAFVGILISAVLFVVGAILNACGLGNVRVFSILSHNLRFWLQSRSPHGILSNPKVRFGESFTGSRS